MGVSFSLFSILFFLIAAAVIGFIIYMIVQKISEEVKNSKAPVQTVSARIVSKRNAVNETAGGMDMNGMYMGSSVSTTHYVTFEAPDGSRLELEVRGSEYGMLAEGDCGELTFQRKRYIGFNRQATPEQMLYAQQIQEQQRLNQAMQEQMRYGQTLPQDTPQNFIQTDDGDQRAQF